MRRKRDIDENECGEEEYERIEWTSERVENEYECEHDHEVDDVDECVQHLCLWHLGPPYVCCSAPCYVISLAV